MALLEGVDGRITQYWGVPNAGVTSLEPAMYASGDKAYWQPYAGGVFHSHFHPGIDIANVEGTPIHAMESGSVIFANLYDAISGIRVEVEIRPGTKYSFNHLSRLAVARGDKVTRGQVIGYVGSTGATTGPHAHQAVSHYELDVFGVGRTFLYNPALFLPGGRLQDVAWIKPAGPPPPAPVDPKPVGGLPVAFTAKYQKMTIRASKPLRVGPRLSDKSLGSIAKPTAFNAWGYVKGDAVGGSSTWYFGPLYLGGRWQVIYTPTIDVVL